MIRDLSEALQLALDLTREHLDDTVERPVRPRVDPDAYRDHPGLALPREGRPLEQVLEDLRFLLAHTPHTAGPGFFNQLFGGHDPAAVLGEVLATVANTSMYTYKAAGVQVLVEDALVQRLGELLGFDTVEGVFTPGGSLSNLMGMLVARNRAFPGLADEGCPPRPMRAYTSEACHYSVTRAAMVLGIGRANLVTVPTDDDGRMDPEALRDCIRRDREAGLEPFFVNATAGTTVLGRFDPIDAIADITEAEGLWLHVDAAVGGPLAFSPRLRDRLAGIHRADSVTLDPHKLMGVPLTCSVALFRSRGQLAARIGEAADYLFQVDTDRLNPGRRSLQCGRRNDALKLWSSWQLHGDAGHARRVEHLVELAAYTAERVHASPGLALVATPSLVTVPFTVDGLASDTVCERLQAEGAAMVGTAQVGDRSVVRLAVLDPSLQRADIDRLLARAAALASEPDGQHHPEAAPPPRLG